MPIPLANFLSSLIEKRRFWEKKLLSPSLLTFLEKGLNLFDSNMYEDTWRCIFFSIYRKVYEFFQITIPPTRGLFLSAVMLIFPVGKGRNS